MAKSTGVRRGRPPANRDKLLAAAGECLRTKGYAKTTARDLAAASGANLASIGYHFGGKEALLNEAIARGMATWASTVEAEVFAPGAATLRERLERALAAMVDRFAEFEPYLRAFVEGFPPALRSPALRGTLAAAYADVRAAGSEMFQRVLADEGLAAGRREAEVLAGLMLAVCDGLILQWLLDPGSTPTSGEIIDAVTSVVPALRP